MAIYEKGQVYIFVLSDIIWIHIRNILCNASFANCIKNEAHVAVMNYYCLLNDLSFNKQLVDEVEHDIMNYQNRGLGYLPKSKAEADNIDTRF